MSIECGLCGSTSTSLWHIDERASIAGREYWRCCVCALIFVAPAFCLSPDEEKQIYDRHQNNPDDAGYRQFLSRTFEPLQELLPAGAEGLDFGCGPGPTLSLMFREAGYSCTDYDIFYAPFSERLQCRYDFITSTEVFEHLARPGKVFEQLVNCLKAGGLLAIMTKRPESKSAFARWHYPLDTTHITFFSDQTFNWIAKHYEFALRYRSKDVVILQCR